MLAVTTALKQVAELTESAEQSEAQIDNDMPLGGQSQNQMICILETTLTKVVAAPASLFRDDIAMTRKDVKDTLGQVRPTLTAQGQSIDGMAGGLTSVNDKIDKGTTDVKIIKVAATEEDGGPSAAQMQNVALANKTFINMEAARAVFKQNMKKDMDLADVSTLVYPSGAVTYEDNVQAVKEVHKMSDKQANADAPSVRVFPRREKTSVKEMRVSAQILSTKSHFGQQLQAKVLAA